MEKDSDVMRQRFRVLLAQKDMTLEELSRRTGMAVSSLSAIRRGHRSPTVRSLEKIADALGVRVKDFFEEDG